MPSLGVPELLLIFFILVVIFGASKLPQLGKGLGEGIRNFKNSLKGEERAPTQRLEDKAGAGKDES